MYISFTFEFSLQKLAAIMSKVKSDKNLAVSIKFLF